MIKELKKYIEKSGLKKAKIAEILDCSPGHLSYVLSGKRDLSIEMELKIKVLVK